jgi:hypothetical protein
MIALGNEMMGRQGDGWGRCEQKGYTVEEGMNDDLAKRLALEWFE